MKSIIFVLLMAGITLRLFPQTINGTHAIQNSKTMKNLRPYEAGKQDGNKIVIYDHVEWKCMTWHFDVVGENTYQLRNLYTGKTFRPAGKPAPGTGLEQCNYVKGDKDQLWEIIDSGSGSVKIRLKGTELYITLADPSGKTNSQVILQTDQKTDSQLWKLVSQNPAF